MSKQPLFYGNPTTKEDKTAATTNGLTINDWIARIKQDILARTDITEGQKVQLAIATLRAEAFTWWEHFSTMNPKLMVLRAQAATDIESFLQLFALGYGEAATGYDKAQALTTLQQRQHESPYQFLMRTVKGVRDITVNARLAGDIKGPEPDDQAVFGPEYHTALKKIINTADREHRDEFRDILFGLFKEYAQAWTNLTTQEITNRHTMLWCNVMTLQGLKDATARDKLKADLKRERNDYSVAKAWDHLEERSAVPQQRKAKDISEVNTHTEEEEDTPIPDTDTDVDAISNWPRGRGRGRGRGGRGRGRGNGKGRNPSQPPANHAPTQKENTSHAQTATTTANRQPCFFCHTVDHETQNCYMSNAIRTYMAQQNLHKFTPNANNTDQKSFEEIYHDLYSCCSQFFSQNVAHITDNHMYDQVSAISVEVHEQVEPMAARPFIPITWGNQGIFPTKALYDTGVSATCISKKFFDFLCKANVPMESISVKTSLCSANGSSLLIHGFFNIPAILLSRKVMIPTVVVHNLA